MAVDLREYHLEERLARTEGILEQLCERVSVIERRLDDLQKQGDSNFKWTLGIILPLILGLYAAVLLK